MATKKVVKKVSVKKIAKKETDKIQKMAEREIKKIKKELISLEKKAATYIKQNPGKAAAATAAIGAAIGAGLTAMLTGRKK